MIKIIKLRFILANVLLMLIQSASAQSSHIFNDVEWQVSAQSTAGTGENAPFWFTSNRYGLGPTTQYSGMTRASIQRDVQNDSLRFWGVGYGADIVGSYGKDVNRFVLQQAYIDIQWKMLRLSVGQKERCSELGKSDLSTGGLVLGTNARPIPQIRFEMPEFWAVPGTRGIFSFKGHIAYGLYTDNAWQKSFNAGSDNLYTSDSWFHSKSLFFRLGNRYLFPLEFSGGVEMACQFKGVGWNMHGYNSTELLQNVELGGNIWTALIPGGEDFNDGFANVAGNHIGSWHIKLDWYGNGWGVGAYMEHMFEDHSQMFMQYGFWKDMLVGLEVNLPINPFLSNIVYEYHGSMNQTGPIIHDATPECNVQISGLDDYYNHHIYGAWQHAGYHIGNPTILSPLYNNNFGYTGSIATYHNRIKAHHIGLKGNPTSQWSWRILYTHERSLGTYIKPVIEPKSANFLLIESTYKHPTGISISLSYGHNDGELLGTSNGAMLTVSYGGRLNRTH